MRNKSNETCLDIAKSRNYLHIITYLERYIRRNTNSLYSLGLFDTLDKILLQKYTLVQLYVFIMFPICLYIHMKMYYLYYILYSLYFIR